MKKLTLNSLDVGDSATVLYIEKNCRMRERLFDLGFAQNTKIFCVGQSPFGNPKAYKIRGTVIALRNEDAQSVHLKGYEYE